jgi:predicted peptidase
MKKVLSRAARNAAVLSLVLGASTGSSAAGLKALTLQATGGTSLAPAFSTQTTRYRTQVQSDIAVVTVNAQAADDGATVAVSVNGKPADPKTPMQAALAVGMNRIEVQVSDAAGRATGRYEMVVEREDIAPVVAKFQKRSFTDAQTGRIMPYRLFVPEGHDAQKPLPLVVFLHGGGERGDDNEKPLTANEGGTIWAKPAEQAKRPAFVLVPQGRSVWDGGFGRTRNAENKLDMGRAFEPADDLRTAQNLLRQVLADFPGIDRKRLYLTGLSQGGLGTWAWNVLQPDLFAAMVPVCGGADAGQAGRLKDKPIWAFHAAADPVVPADFTRQAIAAVKAAGGKPRYTEYDASTYFFPIAHFSWVPAYQNEEMRSWLFEQSR